MAMIDTPTGFAVRPVALLKNLKTLFTRRPASLSEPEDARNRRAFVQEMSTRNPEAFSSDYDMQSMMQHFPAHF